MVHIYRDLRKIKNSSPSIHPHTTQFRVTRKYLLEMMLNPKRLFEQMCFKCSLEGWHTTTTPDLFWQIVLQTRSQNTKCTVTISSACSCGFKNEDEIHFFLACPLYYRPRVTLLNALAHIAPLTVRTLLYGNDTFEFEENKIIIVETLRFIKESKRFD